MPIRTTAKALALFFCTFIAACSQPAATTQDAAPSVVATQRVRPNIVHIVADDLGFKDVGFNGATDIKTPNIDALAASGTKLSRFYVQPMCTPTRACLMTGRYPMRYGLQTAVILSIHTYGLPTDEWLMPQAMKEAGYQTAIIGKWHLGHADQKFWPRQRGFDYQYGPMIGEIDYFTHKEHGVTDWYRDNKQIDEPGYSTNLLGDDAVRYIENRTAAQPFYLYLTFNAPHTPYQAPKEYEDRFSNIQDPTRRTYAGMISCMDDQIGRVVAALDKKGLRENTLIVFHSDNGGTRNAMFAGVMTDMSKVKIPCDNGSFREGKGSLYEGGTRVCALANWPGHIRAGSTVDGTMHAVDLYPTLASIAGASTAKCKPLDGVNAWPTISTGAPSARTEVVYNVEPFRAAVSEGNWKLVWKTPLPSVAELFDLASDPGETKNVAADHPQIVAKLQKRANELAATAVKPKLLETEFGAMRARMNAPPALPGNEFQLDSEH